LVAVSVHSKVKKVQNQILVEGIDANGY